MRDSPRCLAIAPASNINHGSCWLARVRQMIPNSVWSSSAAMRSRHRCPLVTPWSDIHGSTACTKPPSQLASSRATERLGSLLQEMKTFTRRLSPWLRIATRYLAELRCHSQDRLDDLAARQYRSNPHLRPCGDDRVDQGSTPMPLVSHSGGTETLLEPPGPARTAAGGVAAGRGRRSCARAGNPVDGFGWRLGSSP